MYKVRAYATFGVDSFESLRDLFKFCANVAFRFTPFGLPRFAFGKSAK